MNRTFAKLLRRSLIVTLATVAISALLALIFLAVVPWLPEVVGDGRVQWGEHSIALSNVFSGGVIEFITALALTTMAILISAAAIVFSLVVTVIVLAATAAVLVVVAGVIAMPFLLMVGPVWWIMRRNRRHAALTTPGLA